MFGLFGGSKKQKVVRRTERAARKEEKQVMVSENKEAKSKKGQKFGGYTVNFKNENTPLKEVFGDKPVAPSEMTKKLWGYVKKKNLDGRKGGR